jgi:ataxia telangiectasia mutated family protein
LVVQVVPFTPRDGLLEWVEQTIPLASYLMGAQRQGGAHALYRPQDWTIRECREYLAAAAPSGGGGRGGGSDIAGGLLVRR